MKPKRDVAVTKYGRKRVLRWFSTIRQAENYVAAIEKRSTQDRYEVFHGYYGIDASERAHAQYARLLNRSGR